MKKINLSFKIFLAWLLLGGFFVTPMVLAAQPADETSSAIDRLENIVGDPDNPSYDVDLTDENSFAEYIGLIINVALGLLGVVFLGLMLWAGYMWMTAGGNEEKVSSAGHTIKVAIIGLLIVIGSFAIWRFVFERIVAK